MLEFPDLLILDLTSLILSTNWQKWENYDGVPSFWWVNSQRTKSNLIFLVIGQTSIIESHIYIRTYTLSCLFHGLQNVSEKCGLHDQKKKKKAFEILMEDCAVQLFIVHGQNNKIYFRSLVYGL